MAGNTAYALSQWGVTVALAKLGSPTMVGEFALALALTNPIIVLSLLQLRGVILTEAGSKFAFSTYLALRVTLSCVALMAAVLVAWNAAYPSQVLWTVAGVGLWKVFDAICDVYYGRWQAREEMDRVSKALVLNGCSSIAAVVCVLMCSGGVMGAAVSSAAGSAITLGYVIWQTRDDQPSPKHQPEVAARPMFELAKLAAPLGVVMALMSYQANVPRYYIGRYLGVAELGMFAAASQLTLAGGNLVTAFATVASPRLARYHAQADYGAFRGLLTRLVLMGLALGGAGAVLSATVGAPILSFLYQPEYARATPILVWLSIAAGMTYAGSFLGYAMTIAGAMRSQAPLFVVVLAVTAAGCAVCVPRWGCAGAAIALGAATLIQVLGSIFIVRGALRATASTRTAFVETGKGK